LSTLSLHDALPICRIAVVESEPEWLAGRHFHFTRHEGMVLKHQLESGDIFCPGARAGNKRRHAHQGNKFCESHDDLRSISECFDWIIGIITYVNRRKANKSNIIM